jgi:septal ring factor EnvC (AmiA/AmiB activator)
MDEISLSPHLHLTYVPVVEQKRGQTVANSQSGALKAMGFESDKKADENGDFQTGQMKWQTRERERVIEIADKFGLSVGYQRGNRGKGLTIEDYRVAKQKEREALMSQEAIEKRKSELAEVQSELNRTTVEFNALSEDLYDTVAALSDSKSELRETEQEILEKTEELNHLSEQVDQIPDVLNQSVDLCEQEMKAKLIPPVSPTDNYERTTKGVLSSKKTYVMVPEKDYEVLERRNGLKPQAVHGIIKDALQPLRDAIVQLPVVKNLIATIQRLEHEVGEWRKRCRKAEREKEALQKENTDLKTEKSVADRVMYKKLGLAPHVIDKMKADAAREILQEQQRDDDVLF